MFSNPRRFVLSLIIVLLAWTIAPTYAADTTGREPKADRDARMAWWRDARFGMFIHWGIYAVPAGVWDGKEVGGGGEWILTLAKIPLDQYEALEPKFNPVDFDADRWASIAHDAGMKYLVITSKHHDGFCMFDTRTTDYNIMKATPWHKDPLALLAEACPKHGVKFCVYYSIMDWHSPDQVPGKPDAVHPEYNPTHFAPGRKDHYITYMRRQLAELIAQYHPAVLWFDGQWMGGWTDRDGKDLVSYLRGLDPKLIINDRTGGGGDFGTPEQNIPDTGLRGRDWETCMTINDTWGYKAADKNFKPADTLIRNLIETASKGGNYLLNVGPSGQGVIPEGEVERLQQMGTWLKTNGQAIYGTAASPFKKLSFDGRCTVKGNTLYVHVFKWPSGGVTLPNLKARFESGRFLDGEPAEISSSEGSGGTTQLTIKPPAKPDVVATVVAVTFASPPVVEDLSQLVHVASSSDASLTCKAHDAMIEGSSPKYESGGALDDIGNWGNAGDTVSWELLVPADHDYTINITYACANDSAGSTYAIDIDGAGSVKSTIAATGGWANFKSESLGKLHIPAGRHFLTVRPIDKPKYAVMNLRAVVLMP